MTNRLKQKMDIRELELSHRKEKNKALEEEMRATSKCLEK